VPVFISIPTLPLTSCFFSLSLCESERAQVHELTHPSSLHVKEYIVDCEGHVTDEKLKLLRNGILLEGEKRPTLPAVRHLVLFCPADAGIGSTILIFDLVLF
jgi:hypothetical protein